MANYFQTAALKVGSPRRTRPNNLQCILLTADSTSTTHGHGTADAALQ